MHYRFIKFYAVLSSLFTALLLLELTLALIDPGLTRSTRLYSRLMETRQDVKQHLKLQSCLITTKFTWCASQEDFGKTPMIILEPERGMSWPPSGLRLKDSSPTQ